MIGHDVVRRFGGNMDWPARGGAGHPLHAPEATQRRDEMMMIIPPLDKGDPLDEGLPYRPP